MARTEQDEVARASEAVRRAIGRLVALLGDEDEAVLHKAAIALAGLGAAAVVGPLAAALPGARSPAHRLAIAGALSHFARERNAEVAAALVGALKRERDPLTSARLRAVLVHVMGSGIVSSMQPVGVGDAPA